MIPITSFKNEPYMFYVFNSKKSYSEYEFIHVNVDKMVDVNVVCNKQPVQCRVDANPRVCCSSNQFIKLINGHPSDMQSSAFHDFGNSQKAFVTTLGYKQTDYQNIYYKAISMVGSGFAHDGGRI